MVISISLDFRFTSIRLVIIGSNCSLFSSGRVYSLLVPNWAIFFKSYWEMQIRLPQFGKLLVHWLDSPTERRHVLHYKLLISQHLLNCIFKIFRQVFESRNGQLLKWQGVADGSVHFWHVDCPFSSLAFKVFKAWIIFLSHSFSQTQVLKWHWKLVGQLHCLLHRHRHLLISVLLWRVSFVHWSRSLNCCKLPSHLWNYRLPVGRWSEWGFVSHSISQVWTTHRKAV